MYQKIRNLGISINANLESVEEYFDLVNQGYAKDFKIIKSYYKEKEQVNLIYTSKQYAY